MDISFLKVDIYHLLCHTAHQKNGSSRMMKQCRMQCILSESMLKNSGLVLLPTQLLCLKGLVSFLIKLTASLVNVGCFLGGTITKEIKSKDSVQQQKQSRFSISSTATAVLRFVTAQFLAIIITIMDGFICVNTLGKYQNNGGLS